MRAPLPSKSNKCVGVVASGCKRNPYHPHTRTTPYTAHMHKNRLECSCCWFIGYVACILKLNVHL